jgi:hypothetical protein
MIKTIGRMIKSQNKRMYEGWRSAKTLLFTAGSCEILLRL